MGRKNNAKTTIAVLTGIFSILGVVFKVLSFIGKKIYEAATYRPPPRVIKNGLYIPYKITYTDENGKTTKRTVDVQTMTGYVHDDGRVELVGIWGFCNLRDEDRTFKIDRISSLQKVETKEKFTTPSEIMSHFLSVYYYDEDADNDESEE